jgi:hypothetical protein
MMSMENDMNIVNDDTLAFFSMATLKSDTSYELQLPSGKGFWNSKWL